MNSWPMRLALFLALGLAVPGMAASYHGVEVGQRDDFLPPEFDQVARGRFEARFGNELMQVFVEGAQVTGMKVVPLAASTLAEAIATHSPDAHASQLQYLLDFNQVPIGIVDLANRVAYFTRSNQPEALVEAVGYFNDQTNRMIYTAPMPTELSQSLIEAAERSRANLDSRPELGTQQEQASYLVEQATANATREAQRALSSLRRYQRLCTGTRECDAMRQTQATSVLQAALRFGTGLRHAQALYSANAGFLGNVPPEDLLSLQDFSDSFFAEVRAAFNLPQQRR